MNRLRLHGLPFDCMDSTPMVACMTMEASVQHGVSLRRDLLHEGTDETT